MAEEKPKKKPGVGKWTLARHIVQVLILLLFLAPVFAAGWMIAGQYYDSNPVADAITTPAQMIFFGSLSSSSIGPITLIDPFAFLQVVAAAKAFDPAWLLGALVPLVFFAVVRGRAYCGWACPVNLVGELVDAFRKKVIKNDLPEHVLPRHTKIYVALGILVLSALFSVPVFEIVNPISFINKGLIFGSIVGGITLLCIIVVELVYGHRVWCRAVCPLGGFYEVVGKVGLVKVECDHDKCIKCKKCRLACLSDPEILEPVVEDQTSSIVCAGDCMVCGKCIDACPTQALAMKIALPTGEQLGSTKRTKDNQTDTTAPAEVSASPVVVNQTMQEASHSADGNQVSKDTQHPEDTTETFVSVAATQASQAADSAQDTVQPRKLSRAEARAAAKAKRKAEREAKLKAEEEALRREEEELRKLEEAYREAKAEAKAKRNG